MDKKILLSGAAALIMGASLFAAPASANITLSQSGEATLSILMSDHCNTNDVNLTDTAVAAVFAGDGHGATAAHPDACTDEENPVWSTDVGALEFEASGTLANGLGVTVKDNGEISFDASFGTLTFAGDPAIKAARVGGAADPDVVGWSLGGHADGTSGSGGGMVVLYQAPSMGGMDLFVSYAPNSGGDDEVGDTFTDTIGFGAKLSLDAVTIGAGFESATNNGSADCDTALALADGDAAAGTFLAQAREFGGAICGDETVMAFGAEFAAGDMTVSAGYSQIDSDQADQTVMNLGLGMDVGAYALTLDYVDAERDYTTDVADTQTIVAVGASTPLGDGVDLGLSFSNNQMAVAGTDSHTNYRAEAKITIKY